MNNLLEEDFFLALIDSSPTLIGAGQQWTVSINTTYIHWLSLAKPTLKMVLAGRCRLLPTQTNKYGHAINEIQVYTRVIWPQRTWHGTFFVSHLLNLSTLEIVLHYSWFFLPITNLKLYDLVKFYLESKFLPST